MNPNHSLKTDSRSAAANSFLPFSWALPPQSVNGHKVAYSVEPKHSVRQLPLSSGHEPTQLDSLQPPLTERQLECLDWIRRGKSSTDVGTILKISGRTVDYHVAEICRRLQVRTRVQAVAEALQRGWLKQQ